MAFGDFSTYVEDLAQSSNGTGGFVQKLRLTTPAVIAGDYRIGWSFTFGNSSASSSTNVEIDLDEGTILWSMNEEPKDAGLDQQLPGDGFAQVTLTAGIHTFDMDYLSSGGATAYIAQARMDFWSVT